LGGLAEVTFWPLPTIVFYMVLARRPATLVLLEGCALIGLLGSCWWSFSTDWHSTASFGPGVSEWIVAPALIVDIWVCQELASGRTARKA
jgi:hypothetical protein